MELITALIAAVATIIAAIIGYYARKKNKVIYNKLRYHSAHEKLETYKEYIKYEMEADKPGKEGLVKDFLLNMIHIYQDTLKELAQEVDENNFTDEELLQLNYDKLHQSIDKRSTYFYSENYTHEEKIALEILVKKYQNKQSKRIEHFKETMERIVYSHYYKEQTVMQSLIFENYVGEFAHIFAWFDDVIDDINGEFSQLKFRGDIISK